MNNFPLIKKLGLYIESHIRVNYDGTKKETVHSISADDLEKILQNAEPIYFSETYNGRQNFNHTKGSVHTHAGLLLMPSEIFICKTHEPAFHDLVTECKHCGVKLKRGYTAEE